MNTYFTCLNIHFISAEVGPGSTVEVIIESSDNAYGTFQFADDSLSVEIPEAQVGFSAANIQVSLRYIVGE